MRTYTTTESESQMLCWLFISVPATALIHGKNVGVSEWRISFYLRLARDEWMDGRMDGVDAHFCPELGRVELPVQSGAPISRIIYDDSVARC